MPFNLFVTMGISLLLVCANAFAGNLEPVQAVPVPKQNAQTPEKIELGKKLFFDRQAFRGRYHELLHLPRSGEGLLRRPGDIAELSHDEELEELPDAHQQSASRSSCSMTAVPIPWRNRRFSR